MASRASRGNADRSPPPRRGRDDLEHDWAAQVRRLEAEVAGLRLGMRTRGLIEQAKGILAERLGIDPEEAFGQLSRMSQRTNVRLLDVATDIVGALAPADEPPANERGVDPPSTPRPSPQPQPSPQPRPSAQPPSSMRPRSFPDTRPPSESGSGDPAWRRVLRRLTAAADAARTVDELALAVVDNLGAPRPRAVVLFGLEASGGQRMLAANGWPARIADDWLRVPSVMATPANDATRRGHPVWLDGLEPHAYTLIGTAPRRAVLPLRDGARCVGALEVAWDHPGIFDDPQRRFLQDAADTLGPRLVNGVTAGSNGHRDGHPAPARTEPPAVAYALLEATIDAMLLPAQLLTPVRDDAATVVDFVIEYANAAAMRDPSAPFTFGRRLLDTDPDLLDTGAFDGYVRAMDSGEPMFTEPVEELTADGHQRVRRSAVRLRDRLLVSWQVLVAGQTGGEQAERMEILGEFGWGEWTRDLAPIAWSPGLFRLLGRTPARGALNLSRVLARVLPDDLSQTDTMLRRTLHEGREATVELRLDREGDVRDLRVVAEPRLDHRGQPATILALVQDVTQTRRRDRQLSRREEQLATQRIHGAAEQAYTDELRRLLYPPAEHTRVDHRVTLRARHVAPKSIQRFRGDFYDIVEVPDGIVLTVGDVFGSGVPAATTMVRLRHAGRALSLAEVDPAEILSLLNGELHSDEEPPLASLVVARFRHSDLSLRWAQAGHFAPALIRSGRTRSLNRPEGIALGLTNRAHYEEARLTLRDSDVLVFYTDGVLSSLGPVVDPVSHLVRGFGVAHREGGPATLLDRYLRPAEDEACLVTAEIHEPAN